MHGIDSFLDLATLKNARGLRINVFQNEKSGYRKCGVINQQSGISVDIICGSAVLVSIIRPNLRWCHWKSYFVFECINPERLEAQVKSADGDPENGCFFSWWALPCFSNLTVSSWIHLDNRHPTMIRRRAVSMETLSRCLHSEIDFIWPLCCLTVR